MRRRDTPLESWEWNALHRYARHVEGEPLQRLAALLEAERLVRRTHFLMHAGLLPMCDAPAHRMEHRLYALFAE